MGLEYSKPSNEIRTVIMGDIEKLVLILNPNMIVYDLFQMISKEIELISPFESMCHMLDINDFYIDINNTKYTNTNTLKELGETIVVTFKCKYGIETYLKKKLEKVIISKEKRSILGSILSLTESNIYGPDTDIDNNELSSLIYDKYNNAKIFFDLLETKNKIFKRMDKIETALENAEYLEEESLRYIENVHMLIEDQSANNINNLRKELLRQEYQYSKIVKNKGKLQELFNKKNIEYLNAKMKIESLLDIIDIIEIEIDGHLKPISEITFFNRGHYLNDWITKGGSWYLKIKGLNN